MWQSLEHVKEEIPEMTTQNANQRGGLNSSTRSLKISDHSVWLSYIEFEQVGILI